MHYEHVGMKLHYGHVEIKMNNGHVGMKTHYGQVGDGGVGGEGDIHITSYLFKNTVVTNSD